MNVISRIESGAEAGVRVADRIEGLSDINEPGCGAAIWRRQPDDGFQKWIDGLDPAFLPQARMIIRPEKIGVAVTDICDSQGVPDCDERAWMIGDIQRLAAQFLELTPAPFLRVRLSVVTTNMCRKFHIDAVVARLICTYRGTGTQYGVAADEGDPDRIYTVPTGAPTVLRGSLWPGGGDSNVLHRSPPIEGAGETRLVLVLDPILNPDDEF